MQALVLTYASSDRSLIAKDARGILSKSIFAIVLVKRFINKRVVSKSVLTL